LLETSRFQKGFTIVELLIVIVVIAILAAIIIVAYNGIQNKATISSLQSNLQQMSKALDVYKVSNSDIYPTSLVAGSVKTPDTGTYVYQNSASSYCLSGTINTVSYRVTNTVTSPTEGSCSGVLSSGSSCPTGYIVVPGNSAFSTSEFCVMKYEAKNVSGVATSQASTTPWVSITQTSSITTAAAACTGCHLITENEWMTIAANVMSVSSNWSGGTVGTGYVYQGHINTNPSSALAASTDDSDGLNGMTGGTGGAGLNNRRTLTLTNGEVIWDFSGNIWEWTTGTIASGQEPGFSGESAFAYKQWNNGSLLMNGLPFNSRPAAISATVAGYSSTQGIGQLYSNYTDTSTRGFLRGNNWNGTTTAGVLSLLLGNTPGFSSASIGFRVSK
jgi:prepilin-type N-terminal cleavage/methylation domain-containing protein